MTAKPPDWIQTDWTVTHRSVRIGIVPQKMPLTLLHNDMPVIRADYDIVDHDYRRATDVIVERVEKRPVPFHWFRAILKSPSWYKGICDELKQRHTNIELLDAPTFF